MSIKWLSKKSCFFTGDDWHPKAEGNMDAKIKLIIAFFFLNLIFQKFQNSKYWAKSSMFYFGHILVDTKILIINPNIVCKASFGQKLKFWSQMEILGDIRNFGHKSIFCFSQNFWSKVLVKRNFVEIQKFNQKSKLWSKMIYVRKIQNFGQKSKFFLRMKIVVKIVSKSKCWSKNVWSNTLIWLGENVNKMIIRFPTCHGHIKPNRRPRALVFSGVMIDTRKPGKWR